MPLNILIIGMGIAGPNAALLLARQGHKITMIERAAHLRDSGQQVDVRGQAVKAVINMGLEPALRSRSVNEGGIRFFDHATGKALGEFAANTSGSGMQTFSSEYEIRRGDLVRIIVEALQSEPGVRDRVELRYNVAPTAIRQPESKDGPVTVSFSDGTPDETYDLVIGCDGMRSRTRNMLYGDAGGEAALKPSGYYVAFFAAPRVKDDTTDWAELALMPGARAVATRGDDPDIKKVYFTATDRTEGSEKLRALSSTRGISESEQKRVWMDIFKDCGWRTPHFLKALEEDKTEGNWHQQAICQVRCRDPWSKGRLVLLGDAAFCPGAVTGKGTTLATVGAYVLAGEISKHTVAQTGEVDIPAALAAYEKNMRPFAAKVQEVPFAVPIVMNAYSSFAVGIIQWLVWFFSSIKLVPLLTRLFEDDIQGWKLPDYPELIKLTPKAPTKSY